MRCYCCQRRSRVDFAGRHAQNYCSGVVCRGDEGAP
jgi:hypothetical protein